MNVLMWEHHTFDSKVFRCGKIYEPNSIIITKFVVSCTLVPVVERDMEIIAIIGNTDRTSSVLHLLHVPRQLRVELCFRV
jgi:hypothetical protein